MPAKFENFKGLIPREVIKDDRVVAQDKGKWGILNVAKGTYLVEPECNEIPEWNGFIFMNRVAFFRKGKKWGVEMDWGQATKPVFDEYGGDTDDGPVEVKYRGKWGYINEKNEFTADEEEAYYRYYLD